MRKALLVIFLNTLVPGPEDTAACQARDGRLTSRNMRTTNSTLPRLFALVGLAAFVALASSPEAGAGIRFQPVSAPDGADTLALAPDGATLWAGTIRGVWRLSAGAWSFDGLSDKAVSSLAIADGSTVADLGAGGGWFTTRLARRVGPNGLVYAEDIQTQMLEATGRRVAREGLRNVTTVLGTPSDPRLPDGKLDAVLIVDAYHEMEEPISLLRNVRETLKPSGRVGIIDYKMDGGGPGRRSRTGWIPRRSCATRRRPACAC